MTWERFEKLGSRVTKFFIVVCLSVNLWTLSVLIENWLLQ